MKILCIEARAGLPWWPPESGPDVERWADDGAARLVAFVRERRKSFGRILLAVSTPGETMRGRVDPTGYGAARAARAAAHPPAQWAALDGAIARCRDMGAIVVPACAMGATGGRGVALHYGCPDAVGEARDVLATVAGWWMVEAARHGGRLVGPHEGGSLTLVSQRPAVASLVDDAAGVELLWYGRGQWHEVREADVEARHGCKGAALAEALVLGSLPDIGDQPRTAAKGKPARPSVAACLALAHGTALGAVEWAEQVETEGLDRWERATVMALRAAGAGGRERVLRAMAVERLHALPIDVGAVVAPERMESDGAEQGRGRVDDSDRGGDRGRGARDPDHRAQASACPPGSPESQGAGGGGSVVFERAARDPAASDSGDRAAPAVAPPARAEEKPMTTRAPETDTDQPSYLETDDPGRTSAPLARRPETAPVVREERPPTPAAPAPAQAPMGPRTSACTDALYMALATAQMSFGKVEKTRPNDHFKSKYANLADVMEAVLPALKEQGLVPMQIPAGNRLFVRLIHGPSGQWIEGSLQIVPPDSRGGIQALGSVLTYTRRYLLTMMLGIVAFDEDDDGNAATQQRRPAA